MSYKIKGTDIQLTRGDTLEMQLEIIKNDEVYTPTNGDVIRFAMKSNKLNSDKSDYEEKIPLVIKEIPNNTMILKLDPEDTKSLSFGNYVYDIQITFENGDVNTFVAKAKMVITPEVD